MDCGPTPHWCCLSWPGTGQSADNQKRKQGIRFQFVHSFSWCVTMCLTQRLPAAHLGVMLLSGHADLPHIVVQLHLVDHKTSALDV